MNKSFLKIISILVATFLITWTFSCTNPGSDSSGEDTTSKNQEKPEPEPTPDPNPEVKYTITFKANNAAATGSTASITDIAGATVTLPANGFSLEGYTFTGWNTAANGSGTSYAVGASLKLSGDLILYAQWNLVDGTIYSINLEYIESFFDFEKNRSIKQGEVTLRQWQAEGGKEIIITVIPHEFYALETMTITSKNKDGSYTILNISPNNENIYSFQMPYNNVRIKVTFKNISHKVFVDSTGKGEGSVKLNKTTALPGTEITVTIKTENGSVLDDFTIIDQNDEIVATKDNVVNNKCTFILPDADVTINISFKLVMHTIKFVTYTSVEIPPQIIEHNSKLIPPDMEDTDVCCNFKYWKNAPNNWIVTEDRTLYAQWGCLNVSNDTVEEILKTIPYPRCCTIKVNGAINTSDSDENTFRKIEKALKQGKEYVVLDISSIGDLNNVDLHSGYIEEIKLPENLQSINLSNCVGLRSIQLPDGIKTIESFEDCHSITNIELPSSVTSIGTFKNCTKLEEISLPNGITQIGDETFSGCSSLGSIIIPTSITVLGDKSFYGCSSLRTINIPYGVTTIGKETFSDCVSLESVNIPDSVISIGDKAFYNCSKLQSLDLPETLINFGTHVVAKCASLESIIIPNCVSSIESWAFNGAGLKNVTIPNSVTEISQDAFSGLGKLEEITIPFVGASANEEELSESSFFGYVFTDDTYGYDSEYIMVNQEDIISGRSHVFYLPKNLSKVTVIGEKVSDWAFCNCETITDVILADSVTYIGKRAFYKSGLKNLSISDSYWKSSNGSNWLDLHFETKYPQDNAQLIMSGSKYESAWIRK